MILSGLSPFILFWQKRYPCAHLVTTQPHQCHQADLSPTLVGQDKGSSDRFGARMLPGQQCFETQPSHVYECMNFSVDSVALKRHVSCMGACALIGRTVAWVHAALMI